MREIKSSLHQHPDIASLVGLVLADYAMLESFMYVIHAAITGDPDEAFVRFYTLRSSHLREVLMYNAAQDLHPLLQRALRRLWRRFNAAARRRGACAVAMIALLMWGRWSTAEEHTIVTIFGWSLGGFIVAMIIVIVGLLAGGPVGRFKLAASRDGAVVEANGQ
jgi:hypothetical protein